MSQKSILDGIRVASPCSASWEGMSGNDRVRFCSSCGKDVYNIGSMTTQEAVALVIGRRESPPCIQFYRRPDGSVMTSDCPVGSGRVRRRRRIAQAAGLGVVGLALAATGASAIGLRRGAIEPPPSGPGATLDDWIDWALVTVGIRTRPAVTAGMVTPPRMMMGEADAVLTPSPVPGTGLVRGEMAAVGASDDLDTADCEKEKAEVQAAPPPIARP